MSKLHLVGAGRVGKTLAYLLQQQGVQIGGIVCRHFAHAQQAATWLQQGHACADLTALAQLPPASSVLLATPDDAIAEQCLALVQHGVIRPNMVVWHVSGACSSALLAPAQAAGAVVASAHPIRSFANVEQAIAQFAGTAFALEGMPQALAWLTPKIQAIGGQPFELTGDKRLYHAACCVVSNYAVALADFALQLAHQAGLSPETARHILQPLASQSLSNAFQLGPSAALTGPIMRGDIDTVRQHLSALISVKEQQRYQVLGQVALELAAPRLSPAIYAELHALLSAVHKP